MSEESYREDTMTLNNLYKVIKEEKKHYTMEVLRVY